MSEETKDVMMEEVQQEVGKSISVFRVQEFRCGICGGCLFLIL